MIDWNSYRHQILDGVGGIGKLSPDTPRGYALPSGAGDKTGHLDTKTRELIAIGCAVSLRCDGCIATHVKAAVAKGASREEIAEALGVAVSLGAGAALVYSTRTMDALDALND